MTVFILTVYTKAEKELNSVWRTAPTETQAFYWLKRFYPEETIRDWKIEGSELQ